MRGGHLFSDVSSNSTARYSIKNNFLFLASCIAVDSFPARGIAFELLRICCSFERQPLRQVPDPLMDQISWSLRMTLRLASAIQENERPEQLKFYEGEFQ